MYSSSYLSGRKIAGTGSPGFRCLEDALTAIAPSGSFPPYMDGVLLMLEGISPGGVEVHPGGCMYSSLFVSVW